MVWEKLQNAALGGPWSILNVFLATEIFQAPDPRGVLQQGARDVPAKSLEFRVSTFTPPWEGPVRAPWWRQSPSFTWAP